MIKKHQIPNLLTFIRVAAVPLALIITTLAPGKAFWLLLIFAVAAVTDFLDGYLARRWNAVSPLGAMLDPVADKLLVALMLIYLLKYPLMPVLLVALLLLRELYISGLREYVAQRGLTLPVSSGGKWKTALQLIAITALLATVSLPPGAPIFYGFGTQDVLWNGGMSLLWASALLSLISAMGYTRRAIAQLR
jgi:CDP-diacylglycerol--glycerol-3-phosphate 3-phosphatidyltransferase